MLLFSSREIILRISYCQQFLRQMRMKKEDAMRKFAQLLTQYVDTSGMKQTHIATSAHISYNYLQRLLGGNRNPSDQVVYKLAEALHLSAEQTGELLATAGYAPPMSLLQAAPAKEKANDILPAPSAEASQATRLAQELYRL